MLSRRRIFAAVGAIAMGMSWLSSVHAQGIAKADDAAALLPKAIQDVGTLRIAVPDIGKPLAYKMGDQLMGMDVDFANAVAETLGLKPQISLIPFSAALTGLQANRYDISFGEFYVTAARLKVADFVTDWQDYSSFLVTKANSFKPSHLPEICGHTVGAMAGSAEFETLKSEAAKCSQAPVISAFPSISNAILALKSGRVEGVLINRGGAQESIRMDPSLDASGEIGGGPCATAVARNENSAQLLNALKAAFDHLIESGAYAEILAKNDTSYGAAKIAEIYTEGSTPPKYGF